ncbi:FmdB family zinc ribbon protein [Candidatus Poriferisocius sp.]|uniref:FmdB family zinc ribbon protein n=1 Tax=Candidatus Poriferisocius sp. TaxID=3101276 RepID=UPI003B0291BF
MPATTEWVICRIARNPCCHVSCLIVPTYDYSCQTCNARFEVIQSFSEDSLVHCPEAGSIASPPACTQPGKGRVSKVFSVPSITFKGDGFYRNDSRSGTKSPATTGSPNGHEKSGTGESGKTSTEPSGGEPAKPADRDRSSGDNQASGGEPAKSASGSTD